MIDLPSFQRALGALDVGLTALVSAPEDDIIRDACLQRFKYCYELSHTALRRCLREGGSAEADRMSFQTMVRLGVEQGLLARGWDAWSEYRVARASASEDGDRAAAAVAILPKFLTDADFLCAAIARRQT